MAFVTEGEYKNICRVCFGKHKKDIQYECIYCNSVLCNKCEPITLNVVGVTKCILDCNYCNFK